MLKESAHGLLCVCVYIVVRVGCTGSAPRSCVPAALIGTSSMSRNAALLIPSGAFPTLRATSKTQLNKF